MSSEKQAAVLRPRAAAEYLGLSVELMRRWRRAGDGPRFIKLGERAIGYRAEDLNAWLVSRGEGLASE